jgi:hypothetical protein
MCYVLGGAVEKFGIEHLNRVSTAIIVLGTAMILLAVVRLKQAGHFAAAQPQFGVAQSLYWPDLMPPVAYCVWFQRCDNPCLRLFRCFFGLSNLILHSFNQNARFGVWGRSEGVKKRPQAYLVDEAPSCASASVYLYLD